ncbi:MAG: hypothetical protein COW84_12105 [Gammaproteobacteria bacterium CG22_combo_CG10-13_8_21_14_all_40_8]|nr:MAG: hypothetical protein COW84_12105 [Gammaproteobacteria bacterium CG22_combo_CG10-13_8_21_14_all_40_8]
MSLQNAFEKTCYQLSVQAKVEHKTAQLFDLHIGVIEKDFQTWLDQNHIQHWGIITAYNPQSRQLSINENQQRSHQLHQELLQQKWNVYPTTHLDPDHQWPDEQGYFIANIPQKTLLTLASQYQQLAIVYGEINSVPTLIWC